MLNVLLESKAQHTRRVGGTLASALIHGAIITAAVLLTVQQPRVLTRLDPPEIYHDIWPTPPTPPTPTEPRPATSQERPAPSPVLSTPIPVVDVVPNTITPVDPNLTPITTDNVRVGPGPPPVRMRQWTCDSWRSRRGCSAPRIRASPTRSGRAARAGASSTLGRAEMSEFKIVDATDSLLGDAVRAVLPRFRFTPGEAAGRKVRTMVALPFDFTLVR